MQLAPQEQERLNNDWAWADRFIPEIKMILGGVLLTIPTLEEDRNRCTDLHTLILKSARIACRVRRSTFRQYEGEFTLRAYNRGNGQSEYEKVMSGWGDLFFYGFADDGEGVIDAWQLLDLGVFRREMTSPFAPDPQKVPFGDGSCHFLAFKIDDFPADFVIAASGD